MKICLVNDTSDDANWGARATSSALRDLIRGAGGHVESTLYQYRIGVPQESDTTEHSDHTIGYSSSGIADVAPKKWDDFDHCAQQVMKGFIFPEISQALSVADLVLINGEGCIYDRTRQSRMIFFVAYLAKRYFGIATVMANHSIVMNDPVLVEIAQHVFPILDDVVFREADSSTACPGFKGRVAADAAYLYSPISSQSLKEGMNKNADAFESTRPYICVGGGSVYFRELRPDHDAVPGFTLLCEKLLGKIGQVVLTASSHKDLVIMEPVSRKLGLPLMDETVSIQKAVDILGNSRVYIGARWHPSIFAHSGGTPVIALSKHTPKMDAFIKQAGMKPTQFDPFSLEDQVDDIVSLASDYLSSGEPLRQRLRDGASWLGELSKDNVRALSQFSR